MSGQPNRLATGGRIDRTRTLLLSFDGRQLLAHPGDTLASALLANGEKIVARSFKYHRPRGIMSASAYEPAALVHLSSGARSLPNTPATTVEAYDGLAARGQNSWPNVRFDIGAVNQLLSPFIGAGFYYKTFMGPAIGPLKGTRFWMWCEHVIRRAAGMGRAEHLADPDHYEKVNAHCDVLVIGAGPAGLTAALAAGRTGARVILAEQDSELGGSLLNESAGSSSDDWCSALIAELRAMDNVRILTRATVFGAYDGGVYGLVERCWDHVAVPPDHQPRQRYWQVRTKRAVLATGAMERPLVFGGNDRPGVMFAGGLRGYINRYGVLPGRDVVITTNNDSAYAAAIDAAAAGARVTLVDQRTTIDESQTEAVTAAGVRLMKGSAVLSTKGWNGLSSVVIGAGRC